MAKSDDRLFVLIKSLSRSEKGYFKKFSSLHGREERIYIKLFDAVAQQKSYDEKKLLVKFKNEKFVKHFSETKKYLFESILKALSEYSKNASAHYQIHALLDDARVLIDKNILYDQATRYLQKALKLAEQRMFYPQKLIVLDVLFDHLAKRTLANESALLENINEQLFTIEGLKNATQYRSISLKVYSYLLNNRAVVNKNSLTELNKIIDHPLMKDVSMATTAASRLSFNDIMGKYHAMMGNNDEVIKYLQDNYEFLVNSKKLFTKFERHVVNLSATLIYTYLNLKKYDEFKHILATLYAHDFQNQTADLRKKELIVVYTTHFQFIKGSHNEFIAALNDYNSFFDQYLNELHANIRPAVNFQLITFSMRANNAEMALHNIEHFVNYDKKSVSHDIACMVRLLKLMCYFDLGQNQLVQNSLKATTVYLKKYNQFGEIETTLLKLLGNLAQKNTKKATKEYLEVALKALKTLRSKKFELRKFEYFEFDLWIEGKQTGETIFNLSRRK